MSELSEANRLWHDLGLDGPTPPAEVFEAYARQAGAQIRKLVSPETGGEDAKAQLLSLGESLHRLTCPNIVYADGREQRANPNGVLEVPAIYNQWHPEPGQALRIASLLDWLAQSSGAPLDLELILEVDWPDDGGSWLWLRPGDVSSEWGVFLVDTWGRFGDFATGSYAPKPRTEFLLPGPTYGRSAFREGFDGTQMQMDEWMSVAVTAKGKLLPDLSFLQFKKKELEAFEQRVGRGYFAAVAAIARGQTDPVVMAQCQHCGKSAELLFEASSCLYCVQAGGVLYQRAADLVVPADWYRDPFRQDTHRFWDGNAWRSSRKTDAPDVGRLPLIRPG